ncbi:DUF983 domain-containing protein [Cognatishimia sp.]|uniref:DUF983 domain-containing protein n=1 Tax=Cognatishimia sp. TaxID=2211648 RepID=UPI003513A9F1
MSDVSVSDPNERPLMPSIVKGLQCRCPNCGKGRLLHSYLKVVDSCSECGEDYSHQRADDGPAYLTILVVGHVIIFFLTTMWEYMRPSPLTLAITMCSLAAVVALLVLPRFKGMIVAWQWAKRMHGF